MASILCYVTMIPTFGTANPSAKLGLDSVYTGFPAFIAALKLAHISDSTACNNNHRVLALCM